MRIALLDLVINHSAIMIHELYQLMTRIDACILVHCFALFRLPLAS